MVDRPPRKVPSRRAPLTACTLVLVWSGGCAPYRFVVSNAPAFPEQAPHFRTQPAATPVVVQIANFTVRDVDTDFSAEDEQRCRLHYALAVPNLLQEFVGKRQVFTDVTRAASADPATADYLVSGDYDFLLHAGPGGRQWIPIYGLFGRINEAHGRDTIHLRVNDARSGIEVLRRSFTEEHRERTTVWEPALVYLLQADYVSTVAAALIDAIQAREATRSSTP